MVYHGHTIKHVDIIDGEYIFFITKQRSDVILGKESSVSKAIDFIGELERQLILELQYPDDR